MHTATESVCLVLYVLLTELVLYVLLTEMDVSV